MNDIVFQGSTGQPLTNSLLVAEKFGKRHSNVIRDIERLLHTEDEILNSKLSLAFESNSYIDSTGKSNPVYIMNRDGFTLLAMGFTGKKALQFKLEYIEAFNKMERAMRESVALSSPVESSILQQLLETTRIMSEQISSMQEELSRQRSNIMLPDNHSVVMQKEPRISPRQCKYYTVKQMAKALGTDARDLNVFIEYMGVQIYDQMKQRWVLSPQFMGCGFTYTVVYEPVDPDDEPNEYMVWTQKGRDYIWKLLLDERRKYRESKTSLL